MFLGCVWNGRVDAKLNLGGCLNVWGFWCCCGFVAWFFVFFVFFVYMIDMVLFVCVFVCFLVLFILCGFEKIEMEKK